MSKSKKNKAATVPSTVPNSKKNKAATVPNTVPNSKKNKAATVPNTVPNSKKKKGGRQRKAQERALNYFWDRREERKNRTEERMTAKIKARNDGNHE